jgi:hypothetical protein
VNERATTDRRVPNTLGGRMHGNAVLTLQE